MKKKHFSWALVAALSFGCMFTTACSDDDPVQTEEIRNQILSQVRNRLPKP